MSRKPIEFTEADVRELEKKFEAMSFKDTKKVYQSTLTQSANIVKKQTKANLKSIVTLSGRLKVSKPMQAGIKARTIIKSSKVMYSLVHIMGDYRLRWYELGTKDRLVKRKKRGGSMLKKERYTGFMSAHKFFYSAQLQTKDKVFKEMEIRIATNINKIWNQNH